MSLRVGATAADPMSWHLFFFCNRHRNRMKVLVADESGPSHVKHLVVPVHLPEMPALPSQE